MITQDTPVTATLVYRSLALIGLAAAGSAIYMLLSGRGVLPIVQVLGGAFSVVPVALAVRDTTIATMADIYAVSRITTKTSVAWLVMMAIYLLAGMPMGREVFDAVVGVCVLGLVAVRVLFPMIAVFLVQFSGPTMGPTNES